MRVTFGSMYRNAMADLATAATRLARAQQQVTSGKRISVPSDDPSAAQAVVNERGAMAVVDRYQQATDSVESRLSIVDTVLSDIITQLTAAKSAAAGAAGSVPTESQREAIAVQLEGIRDALLSDFNTSSRGTYLFAGSAATTAPFVRAADGTISAYRGDARTVMVDIDQNQTVRVSFNGDDIARGSDADGLFVEFDRLIAAVRGADTTGVETGMAALQRAFDRAVRVQGGVGTDLKRLEEQRLRLDTLELAVQKRLSAAQDADMAQAITEMTQADTAYKAALGATATISSVSLMDYLK